MNHRLKRIRGALGMGLIWAVAWAPVAVIVGTRIIDPDNSMDEMWWMIGAMPGFLSGVVFSAVLSKFARRRKLAELSIPHVAAWGGLAGAAIGVLPFILGDTGGRPWIGLAAGVIGSFATLSALSAAGSLALAQSAERQDAPNLGDNAETHRELSHELHEPAGLPASRMNTTELGRSADEAPAPVRRK